MKTYNIVWSAYGDVDIEAENENEAEANSEIKPIGRKSGPITLAEFSNAMFGFSASRLRERERMRQVIEQKDMKR